VTLDDPNTQNVRPVERFAVGRWRGFRPGHGE
jgi:hypothetical protein